MSRTTADWLGRQTLAGAIAAAITRENPGQFEFLGRLARREAVPEDCDARFVEIARFLVTGEPPNPSCHEGFERTWAFFRRLCLEVCAEIAWANAQSRRFRDQLERASAIAGWAKSLEEIWSLPPRSDRTGRNDPEGVRRVTWAEAIFVWLNDPRSADFLETGTAPPQIPKARAGVGSAAQQTVIAALLDGVHRRILTVGCAPLVFLTAVADWMGDADEWPNWNMHASFWSVSEMYGFGHTGEQLPNLEARRIANAWPQVARSLGRSFRLHDDAWGRRASDEWTKGVLLSAAAQLPQNLEEAAEAFAASPNSVERRALWKRWSHAPQAVPMAPENPFDTRVRHIHPFVALRAAVTEPPYVTLDEVKRFVNLRA